MRVKDLKFAGVSRRYRATVLIITIWIVFVLASLVIVLAQFIRVEAMASANYISFVKAESIANGAINYIIAYESSQGESEVSYTSDPYEAMPVGDGYFWVLKPNLSDDKNYDFGVVDESAKVNLNSAPVEMMLKLPFMTAELANSIKDWRDSDEEITSGGAENEYYLLLGEPYFCKNEQLESIEEVLLIKGATVDYIFGEDYNRNGILDDNENDADRSQPSDNSNGTLDAGFFNYVTVSSYESGGGGDESKINVNDSQSLEQLSDMIEEVVGDDYFEIMSNIRTRRNYDNLIELYYSSLMEYDDFAQIVGKLTTSGDEEQPGLININTAPEEVLLCLPGLEQSDVDAIIQEREDDESDGANMLWITKALDQEKATAIGSDITINSSQYSADIVAATSDGRAFCRFFVVIDMAEASPRVIYKQPLNHLGWPLDPKILENLRNGNEI